jgi:serine O-acetyltransferase
LRCELETLRGRIAMLIDERDAARAKNTGDRERA